MYEIFMKLVCNHLCNSHCIKKLKIVRLHRIVYIEFYLIFTTATHGFLDATWLKISIIWQAYTLLHLFNCLSHDNNENESKWYFILLWICLKIKTKSSFVRTIPYWWDGIKIEAFIYVILFFFYILWCIFWL